MNHVGLFEGIGGFSLAASWMGWETIAWCEIDKHCQQVLKYHFPKAEAHGDITKTDFTRYANTIDILTGGFPCQPYSQAGKRKGTADDRHLWPEMLRAIREIQPRYVVGENVRGLTNWNGGMVFDQVQVDLETEGFEVLPFLLPACAIGAEHKRDRIWFISHNHKIHANKLEQFKIQNTQQRNEEKWSEGRNVLHMVFNGNMAQIRNERGQEIFTEPTLISDLDGISTRLVGVTFPKWVEFANSSLGNAIVPQVAYQIFKAIEQYETVQAK